MVVTAQSPGSLTNSTSTHNSEAIQQQVESAAPSTAPRISPLASAAAVSERSASRRFIVGSACLCISALAAVALSLNPGEQPSRLIALMVAVTGCAVVLGELLVGWILRPRKHSHFSILALVGCAVVIAGSVMQTLLQAGPVVDALLVLAPALAAATLCFGNGFSMLGLAAARGDDEYLFARSTGLLAAAQSAAEIALGARIALKPGDIVPVDGRIELGSVAVDERVFTTVPLFRIRDEQEIVYAGSEVLAGSAEMLALSTRKDACLSQLQTVIAPIAQQSESSLEQEDARASRWTALALLFTSVAAAIYWDERSTDYTIVLVAAGVIAMIGSLCQVGEYLYGQRRSIVRRWLLRGFLLAQPTSCKELARITRVESDPSRFGASTLVTAVALDVLDDRLSTAALCDLLASLLGRAEDRILAAAGEYCRRHSPKLSVERVLELREYAGRGISGTVHGVELSVGEEDFLVERGIMVQPTEGRTQDSAHERLVLVAIDDDVVARFHVSIDQEGVIGAHEPRDWSGGVIAVQSSGAARELGEETLLIRGNESDLIGQTAQREVTLFSPEEGSIRRTTVVAFTPALAALDTLLAECRAHVRAVDRLRLLVGIGGLMTVAAAFGGVATPALPLAWVLLAGASVRLSQRAG
jgi:cation transport ATPase